MDIALLQSSGATCTETSTPNCASSRHVWMRIFAPQSGSRPFFGPRTPSSASPPCRAQALRQSLHHSHNMWLMHLDERVHRPLEQVSLNFSFACQYSAAHILFGSGAPNSIC